MPFIAIRFFSVNSGSVQLLRTRESEQEEDGSAKEFPPTRPTRGTQLKSQLILSRLQAIFQTFLNLFLSKLWNRKTGSCKEKIMSTMCIIAGARSGAHARLRACTQRADVTPQTWAHVPLVAHERGSRRSAAVQQSHSRPQQPQRRRERCALLALLAWCITRRSKIQSF